MKKKKNSGGSDRGGGGGGGGGQAGVGGQVEGDVNKKLKLF